MNPEQKKALAIGGAAIAGIVGLAYFMKKQPGVPSYEPTTPTVLIEESQGGGGFELPDFGFNIPDFKFPELKFPDYQGFTGGGGLAGGGSLPVGGTTIPGTTIPINPPPETPVVPQPSTELSPLGELYGKLGLAAGLATAGTYVASKIGLIDALKSGVGKVTDWLGSKIGGLGAIGAIAAPTGPITYIREAGMLPLKLTDPSDTLGAAMRQGISGNQTIVQIAQEKATEWSQDYGILAPAAYAVSLPLYAAYATMGSIYQSLTNPSAAMPQQQQVTNIPPPTDEPKE